MGRTRQHNLNKQSRAVCKLIIVCGPCQAPRDMATWRHREQVRIQVIGNGSRVSTQLCAGTVSPSARLTPLCTPSALPHIPAPGPRLHHSFARALPCIRRKVMNRRARCHLLRRPAGVFSPGPHRRHLPSRYLGFPCCHLHPRPVSTPNTPVPAAHRCSMA